MGWLASIGLGVVGVLAAVVVAFLVGMRTQNRYVQNAVFWFSKRVINPRNMATAGAPGAYAAIIRAPGRTSGRMYSTPVGAVAVDGGFLVSLPYGSRPNWLRNVLAAGRATLVFEGVEHDVDRPEVIPVGPVIHHFAPSDQQLFRVFAVRDALRLRAVATAEPQLPAAAA
jgi:hypothetical protein